jgi:hypothetical protein
MRSAHTRNAARNTVTCLVVLLTALVLPRSHVVAQETGEGSGAGVGASLDVERILPVQIQRQLVYSAKWLCGSPPVVLGTAVPGLYLTAINIHNPHDVAVSISKKVVVANPQRLPPGAISPVVVAEELDANRAVEVDCADLLLQLQPGPVAPFTGFVVIETSVRTPVVVVAVYTLKNILIVTEGEPPT